jgi:hypothetical protein
MGGPLDGVHHRDAIRAGKFWAHGEWEARPAKVTRLEFDPDIERPTRSITIRLPRRLVQELRVLAKDRDVPYQSLLKVLLAEKVAESQRKRAS